MCYENTEREIQESSAGVADHDLMGRLEEVIEKKGIRIEHSNAITDGGVAYKHKLRTLFVGDSISSKTVYILLQKLTEI